MNRKQVAYCTMGGGGRGGVALASTTPIPPLPYPFPHLTTKVHTRYILLQSYIKPPVFTFVCLIETNSALFRSIVFPVSSGTLLLLYTSLPSHRINLCCPGNSFRTSKCHFLAKTNIFNSQRRKSASAQRILQYSEQTICTLPSKRGKKF